MTDLKIEGNERKIRRENKKLSNEPNHTEKSRRVDLLLK